MLVAFCFRGNESQALSPVSKFLIVLRSEQRGAASYLCNYGKIMKFVLAKRSISHGKAFNNTPSRPNIHFRGKTHKRKLPSSSSTREMMF